MEINDILYTKDGRKSGNLVIIDKYEGDLDVPGATYEPSTIKITFYKAISDYGNIITITDASPMANFFKEVGYATDTHKYHNYKLKNPDQFI